jgi:S-adenosylmethionine:tRNA ribosyltransferase-isomerase
MRTNDFDYHLPQELIAQVPIEPRDSSRLLVLHRGTGQLEHRSFRNILDYLQPGDLMVFNQSRVIAARLLGHRDDTGSKVELLLLRQEAPNTWQALAKPARRLRPGVKITIVAPNAESENGPPDPTQLSVEILESHEDGIKTVRLSSEDSIASFGYTPLPPYIRQRLDDPDRYQTVYAAQPGSAAAPTAGLHFTDSLLEQIRGAGVETTFVTLHVGLDTFRPVQGEDPAQHKIHTEHYEIDAPAADALNRARQDGRRIIAVGTTSVRVLEQAAQDIARDGRDSFSAVQGEAGIYILPGHRFRAIDAMITNFHLPRSTLLMLVSAFVEGPSTVSGRTVVLGAYGEAIEQGYRFYSFGDAMLVL